MFCKYCGAEISDDSTFCSSCGANLTDGKKVQTKKNREKKNNWEFKVLFVCIGLIILSFFLPWVGLDHEKLKQTAINDMEDEYGIVGEYLGNQYMDLAYEYTPLENAKSISLFSEILNSEYKTDIIVALAELLFLMIAVVATFNIKSSKVIFNVILFIPLVILLISLGVDMHSTDHFRTGTETFTVSNGTEQTIDIYEYPGVGRVDSSILDVGLTYKIGYYLTIVCIVICAPLILLNVIKYFINSHSQKGKPPKIKLSNFNI